MSDEYDAEHPETGSGNISKATDEWKQVLDQARANDLDGYTLHHAYALINEQVAEGIPWAKCANCGSPYRMDQDGAGDTVCSSDCFDDYLSYLNGVHRGGV